MANPKNLDSSDRYNPMETPPPVSDNPTSGKKKCYSIFLFGMWWGGESDSPDGDVLEGMRDAIITAVANYLGLWEWVVRLFGGIPPMEEGMTISCNCISSDDDLSIETLLEALNTVIPFRGRVLSAPNNVNPYFPNGPIPGLTSGPSGKASASYFDYEIKEHDCWCDGRGGAWASRRKGKCHGKKTKDFDDITDSSRSYTDSAGGTHDLGANSTRAEKIKKIADAEKEALKSFTCCKDRKKGSTTIISQGGTQLSTSIRDFTSNF
jgi:hypothetical protein